MHANKYRLPRRSIQIGTLMLISLIPALGLFRVDLASASFHVLGHQIWWSNFYFISGLAIVIATVPIITYLTVGAVWCGWACPQNLLSEWANNLTYKFLGKRADVRVDGKGMVVAAAKNKVVNWLILGAIFLAASMVLALVPLLLFYPNGDIWDFITFRASPEMTESMKYAYFFLVLLIFIDIAFVRYFFCEYACFYRMGHILFKTKDALHINYDASRSSDCAKCNYCATSCITAILPTDIKVADPCIGCGECIDACDRLHEKTGTTGLLRFDIGKKVGGTTWGQKFRVFFSRLSWPIGIILVYGCALMAWGIATQAPARTLLTPAQLHKIEFIARTCESRCSAYESTCKGSNIAGCYRASACECECKAQLDPGNPALGSWQQCTKKFTSLANALEARKKH